MKKEVLSPRQSAHVLSVRDAQEISQGQSALTAQWFTGGGPASRKRFRSHSTSIPIMHSPILLDRGRLARVRESGLRGPSKRAPGDDSLNLKTTYAFILPPPTSSRTRSRSVHRGPRQALAVLLQASSRFQRESNSQCPWRETGTPHSN